VEVTVAAAICCLKEDCKTFCPMSRIRSGGQRPSDKYSVNTSHQCRLCKNVSLCSVIWQQWQFIYNL